MDNTNLYATQLASSLNGANPVLSFERVFEGIPFEKVSIRPAGLPYSIWELASHLRIAQNTYLNTARDATFKAPKWPDQFWPQRNSPTEEEWNQCVKMIHEDRASLANLILQKGALIAQPLAHTNGLSIIDIALKTARHNSYHAGEIIILRRLLGIWQEASH